MSASRNIDAPQISFTNWILGGSLISHPSSSDHRRLSRVPSDGSTTEKAGIVTKDEKKSEGKKATKNDGGFILEGFNGLELIIEEDDVAKPAKQTEKGKKKKSEKDKPDEKKEDDDDGGWTAKQDKTILSMKAGNKSWKEISMIVGASKKDVQVRWKKLCDEQAAVDKDGSSGKAKEKGKNGDGKKKGDEEKNGAEEKDNTSKDDGKTTSGRLKSDDIWTREDCELLEMLEARYTEQKWMQLQAGFYNMTGRMVIAEMIEKKFSDG